MNSTSNFNLNEAVNKGILIDILHFFTTSYGTTKEHPRSKVINRYGHISDIDYLLDKLIEAQFLVESVDYPTINNWQKVKSTGNLRLSHDILAPIIRQEFDQSNQLGQIARKLLEQKITLSSDEQHYGLNSNEFKLIRNGQAGMRNLNKEENIFITRSNEELTANKRRRLFIGLAVLISVIGLGILSVSLNIGLKGSTFLNKVDNSLKSKDYKAALYWAQKADQQLQNQKSLKTLNNAILNYTVNQVEELEDNAFFKILKGSNTRVAKDENYIVSFYPEGFMGNDKKYHVSFLYECKDETQLLLIDSLYGRSGRGALIHENERLLLSNLIEENSSFLYKILDNKLELIDTMKGAFGKISPNLKYILSIPRDGLFSYLYRIKGSQLDSLGEISSGQKFSNNSEWILPIQTDKNLIYRISNEDQINSVGPLKGRYVESIVQDELIVTYDFSEFDLKKKSFLYKTNSELEFQLLDSIPYGNYTFDPQNRFILVEDFNNWRFKAIKINDDQLTFLDSGYGGLARFSPDSSFILTKNLTLDKSYLYAVTSKAKLDSITTLPGLQSTFSKDGKYISTVSAKKDSCYFFYIVGKDSVKVIGRLSGTNAQFYKGKPLIYVTNKKKEELTLYKISNNQELQLVKVLTGFNLELSNDSRFAMTSSGGNDYIYIYDLLNDTQVTVDLSTQAQSNASFFGQNGLLLSNENKKNSILWFNNPFTLTREEFQPLVDLLLAEVSF